MARTEPAPWPAGRLAFDGARLPAHSYPVGSFYAHWQTEEGGVLAVRHAARPDRALWSSLPGESFAGATCAGVLYREQSIGLIAPQDGGLVIAGALLSPAGDALDYSLSLHARTAKDLVFTLTVAGGCECIVLSGAADAGERFTGFGAAAAPRDMAGRRVVVTPAAQKAGRAAPHYLTSRLRSLYLEGHAHAVFDLRRAGRVDVCVRAARMTGHILYGEAPNDLLANFGARVKLR